MTITREIGGKPVSIELTDNELLEAYWEQQRLGDLEDVENYLDANGDWFMQETEGLTLERLESLIPAIADTYRRRTDSCDYCDYWEIIYDSIKEVLEQ